MTPPGDTDAALVDRIAGGLLGVHAGDSLGATHEFAPWAAITRADDPDWRLREIIGGGAFGWQPGDATDDTDLTCAVLDAYVHPQGFTLERAADNMVAWLDGGPVDVGGATSAGLSQYRRTGDPRDAGAGPGSAGNGSLMRCITTGLVRTDGETRRRESREISAITHDDARCQDACVAYNEAVAALVDGATTDEALEAAAAAIATHEVRDALAAGTRLDLADLAQRHGNPFGGSGFVLHSLTLSLAALLDRRPLEEVLVDVVHLGGDTDTNGAIAGGLLGVRDGAGAIPRRWVELLQYRDRFEVDAVRLTVLRSEGNG